MLLIKRLHDFRPIVGLTLQLGQVPHRRVEAAVAHPFLFIAIWREHGQFLVCAAAQKLS